MDCKRYITIIKLWIQHMHTLPYEMWMNVKGFIEKQN